MYNPGIMGELDQQLQHLEGSGLVRLAQLEPEIEYLFKHALLQDTAYWSLIRYQRQKIHRAVGEALERLYPDRREELAATLAHHFAEGGDPARALAYFTTAGDAAAQRYATGEAIEHFSRAISMARQASDVSGEQVLHLYTARGRAYELAQRYADALPNYEEMYAVAQQRGDQPMQLAALTARATLLSMPTVVQDAAKSRLALEEARTLAHEIGDATAEARILWTLMLNVLYMAGDTRQGIAYGEQSLALARQYNLREQIAFTQHDLIRMYYAAAENDSAFHAYEEASALWQELNNLPMLADSQSAVATIDLYDGNLARAGPIGQEGYQVAVQAGDEWCTATNAWIMGRAAFEQGELTRAIRLIDESVRIGAAINHPIVTFTRCDLALVYAFIGDTDRALALCDEAIAGIDTSTIKLVERIRAWSQSVQARITAQAGRVEAAQSLIEDVMKLDREDLPALLPVSVQVRLAQAEVALHARQPDRAAAACDELVEHLHSHKLRLWLPEALLVKGRAWLLAGHIDEAVEALNEARRAAEEHGSKRLLWPIFTALAEAESQRGDEALAGAMQGAARRVFGEMAATVEDQALKEKFLTLTP